MKDYQISHVFQDTFGTYKWFTIGEKCFRFYFSETFDKEKECALEYSFLFQGVEAFLNKCYELDCIRMDIDIYTPYANARKLHVLKKNIRICS